MTAYKRINIQNPNAHDCIRILRVTGKIALTFDSMGPPRLKISERKLISGMTAMRKNISLP